MLRLGKRAIGVRSAAAFAVLVLFAAAGAGRPEAFAQVKAKAPAASLQHEVTVTLKLIQVFVTDAAGKPALDLERSDFVLTDNGQIQTITDFEKHVLAVPAAGRAAAAPAPAPAPSAKAEAEAPLLSRKFIFLIDYVQNGFEGVNKAKAAAREFLDSKVGPEDEVGLFTLSTLSGLTLHQYLTKDHGKVRSALKKLRDLPGGRGDNLPVGDLIGMELMNADVFAAHGGHAGPGRRSLFVDIAEWAKTLRAIPGQKNIILFTQGYGNDVVRPGRLNNVLFEAMARALASANAPVFTVDTTPQVAPMGAGDVKLVSGTLAERSLDYLAKTTGGMYMGHVNFSARIATDIQDATANYYVLGYSIPAAWDGKYHDVKVEVRRPGYVVHAQRGYFNPIPFAKLSPIEKHIHLIEVALGDASAKQTPTFPLAAFLFPESGGTNTLLLSEVPGALREAIGDHTEFISLVINASGAIVNGKRAETEGIGLRTGTFNQYETAALAPGRYECRAVLRNLDDGRAAVGSCAVEVPALAPDGPRMFSPLLLVHGAGAQYLNLASPPQGGDAGGFSISSIFPFPANEYVPLVGALEPGATSLHAELICVWKDQRAGEKDLSASLRPEGSEEDIPLATDLVSAFSRDDRDFYLLEFELPPLAPGRYQLEILAEDTTTGATIRTAAWLSIRPRS
jgi:VWFA-related protein